jgi:phospholipid/cholesterol/gamma-HCH transport system ATP-binding protein
MSDVINELILQTRRRRPTTCIVVTHDMKTVQRVAERVVMLFPLSRLDPGAPQVLFDGTPAELARCAEPRVAQFVEGRAEPAAEPQTNAAERR